MELQKTQKVFTSYLPKPFSYLLIGFLICLRVNSYSQKITREFKKNSVPLILFENSNLQHKTIPSQYDTAIKIALLYFPELEKTKIKFRIKKQASPLSARPSIFAIFRKASKRKYLITISNSSSSKFSSIHLSNLSFNAQIGVIGHELSHISDYNTRRGIYFLNLMCMQLSKNKMDQFEYNTDMRCIEHGLGYQLLSWSQEVRQKLNLSHWKGIKRLKEQGKERYMNPESILLALNKNADYK